MKKREIFRWLKQKNFAIYFLQQVHCTKEKENCWTSEWGFSTIFSSFSSASVGTCITHHGKDKETDELIFS